MVRIDGVKTTYLGLQEKTPQAKKLQADNSSTPQIKELTSVKYPIGVNIPLEYTKLGIEKLSSGQEIHNYKLSNGLRVAIIPMEKNTTVLRTFVNTGAINEDEKQRGISHFLEHMAFNGTYGNDGYKKLSTGDVFRIVGKIGGSTNACTNFALTDYYIQAPIFYDTDLEEIIKIQGAMMNNLSLPDSMIEKERGPVISEINMYSDFPDTLAYNAAVKNLYNLETNSPDYIAGTTDNIKNLSRDDVMNYYKQNYHPANMFTTLAGDVEPDEAIKLIAKSFNSKPEAIQPQKVNKLMPIEKPIRVDFVSDKTIDATGALIFNGPSNNNLKDNIIMDFLANILFGNSNSYIKKHTLDSSIKAGFLNEKVSTNPNDGRIVCIQFSADNKDVENALEIFYSELGNFETPSKADVENIKKSLLIKHEKMCKDPYAILQLLGDTHFSTGDNSILKLEEVIKSITAEDISRCAKKYFDLNKVSIAIVHPTDKSENKGNVSFTGRKQRQIFNPEKIKTYKFNNNFDAVSYETNGDYRDIAIILESEKLPPQKPGTALILDEILQNGTKDFSRQEIDTLLSSNLIKNSISANSKEIIISTSCNKSDIKTALSIADVQLYSPNFSEEAFEKAKENIKTWATSRKTYADGLVYKEAYPKNNALDDKDAILASIDSITLDDVKNLHAALLKNSTGQVGFSCGENDSEYKEKVLSFINGLEKVTPKTFNTGEDFTPTNETKVLTHENSNSQADIILGYKYNRSGNLRDSVIFDLLGATLNKMLFNDLREKQQLAYSVYCDSLRADTKNEMLVCGILTTTKDESTGETSYHNVQKSIDGFHKLINDIRNGDFSDEDFESVKLQMKANLLECSDSDSASIFILTTAQTSPYGTLVANKKLALIDTIKKEDIIAAADHIFQNKPLYGITANKETLEYNKDYFALLKTK